MKIKELGKKIKENKYSKYVVFIIVLFIITLLFVLINDDKVVSAISGYENNYSNEYVVEIKGEVNREGIYSISASARINDLIILANGLKQTADVSGINLASKVTDGMVLHIPAKKQTEEKNKLSLNNATLEQLDELDGIGPSKALAIIEYRETVGPFKKIEDVLNVNGISESIYNKIKDYITV